MEYEHEWDRRLQGHANSVLDEITNKIKERSMDGWELVSAVVAGKLGAESNYYDLFWKKPKG